MFCWRCWVDFEACFGKKDGVLLLLNHYAVSRVKWLSLGNKMPQQGYRTVIKGTSVRYTGGKNPQRQFW